MPLIQFNFIFGQFRLLSQDSKKDYFWIQVQFLEVIVHTTTITTTELNTFLSHIPTVLTRISCIVAVIAAKGTGCAAIAPTRLKRLPISRGCFN
jgi:hypothetical protein